MSDETANTDRRNQVDDIAEALVYLREGLCSDIECDAVLRRFDGGIVPELDTLSDDSLPRIRHLLGLIRRLEALAGRPKDDAPSWLDALIDDEGGAL